MKSQKIVHVFAAALFLCVPALRAQNQPGSPAGPIQPLPPAQDSGNGQTPAPDASALSPGQGSAPQSSSQAQPDTRVLSGAETFGLGFLHAPRSIYDPALHITESGERGVVPGRFDTVTAMAGTLALDQSWSQSSLNLVYSGGETLYQPDSSFNTEYQDLAISQQIQRGRWGLRLRDDFQLSPNAAFGGLSTGGPGITAQAPTLNAVAPAVLPGETIQTGQALRLNNTALTEIDYSLSRRTTMTFTGSYGFLHFLSAGFIDSRNINGSAGYNYALDAKNSIGLNLMYGNTIYTSSNSRMNSDTAQASFGRKVTGRLAFQIAGGPQLLRLLNFRPTSGQKWSWSAYTALTYQMRRTGYTLSYSHGTNAGSGVLLGATTDSITAGVHRDFTRFWSGSLNGGYAINNSLAANSALSSRYTNWYGTANLGRQMGQHFHFGLSYQYQVQNGSTGGAVWWRAA